MEQLKRLREARGLSQTKLAARADVNPATVNQIEGGKRTASPATLHKLAAALDVSLYELLEGEPHPKASASSQPSFNGLLEEERHPAILAQGVADAADKWEATVSNPDASPYEVSAAVDAALDLGGALAGQLGEPSAREYSSEKWEGIRLASRLLEISKAGNERILDSGPEEQVNRRREQMRELTRRISA